MINESLTDAALEKLFGGLEFRKEPAGLYDPLRYMISIGGKRIRPRLCLMTYGIFRDSFSEEVLSAAAALEVFHSFTLIHDDIMDRSPLRRGHETVWKKWGHDTAILSGDVMLIDGYRRICKVQDKVRAEAVALFSKTASEVCEGQQYDMAFESLEKVGMDDYGKMIGLKTAVLLGCSAKMGAIVAEAPREVCDALYDYGYRLGMAFQIADDYLDIFGDEKAIGKPIGGDILNGKKSWLTTRTAILDSSALGKVFAMEAGDGSAKAAKIEAAREVYRRYGVDRDAKAEIARYKDLAIDAAEVLPAEAREELSSFANALVGCAG